MSVMLLVCAAVWSATPVSGVYTYDSEGFDLYAYGLLNGQDGWAVGKAAGGADPVIANPADPLYAANPAIQLSVPDSANAISLVSRNIPDPIAAGDTQVLVTFDVYRPSTSSSQDLWWWWKEDGQATYGMQLNSTTETSPLGAAGAVTPTLIDDYFNVMLVWDLTLGQAFSWYNGVLVDNGIPLNGTITSLTGWSMALAHSSPAGAGADTAWIDNVLIDTGQGIVTYDGPGPVLLSQPAAFAIPEPATVAICAAGLISLISRRIVRQKH
jgi:hypothetical protein